MIRELLLVASESRALRERAMRVGFVRRSVSRFMPGERLADAFAATMRLRHTGIDAVLTQLGENVTDPSQADGVTRHYMDVMTASATKGLECEISVKPTQLGLAVSQELCYRNLRTLAAHANASRTFVWVDMEQHTYVDGTLELYRRVLSEFQTVGVCLQAYLYRTAHDLASICPLGGGVRLVKGAYRESATVAFSRKRDVNANFFSLAKEMIASPRRHARFRPVFGTHDGAMIAAIQRYAEQAAAARDSFEFHLLYGIRPAMQQRLRQEGYRVRVLISYGEQWFPWYMRRLAERPANLLFVAKSIFAR